VDWRRYTTHSVKNKKLELEQDLEFIRYHGRGYIQIKTARKNDLKLSWILSSLCDIYSEQLSSSREAEA